MVSRASRARGTLLGQAVGDALGTTVEFASADHIAARAEFDGWPEVLVGKGPFGLAAGQVTDDTELALALARALVAAGGQSEDALEEVVARAYVAWLESDPEDVGITTRRAFLLRGEAAAAARLHGVGSAVPGAGPRGEASAAQVHGVGSPVPGAEPRGEASAAQVHGVGSAVPGAGPRGEASAAQLYGAGALLPAAGFRGEAASAAGSPAPAARLGGEAASAGARGEAASVDGGSPVPAAALRGEAPSPAQQSPATRVAPVIRAQADGESQANGSLMRISPLAVFGARRPRAELAHLAARDATLSHPHPVCQAAAAVFCATIAESIESGLTGPALFDWALGFARRQPLTAPVVPWLEHAAISYPAEEDRPHIGWVKLAFIIAFYELRHASDFEPALVNVVRWGGDTDTNAAITGALLGSVFGEEGVPLRWKAAVLGCAPPRRPPHYHCTDLLALADALAAR